MLRPAKPSDRDAIVSLWQEAFGDTAGEITRFFDSFPDCLSYVTEGVTAMVHALPQVLSPDLPAAYLYAVATAQTHRGQGLCRSLLAFAEADLKKRGFACCVLVPGAPSLFDFYRKLGYETAFYGSHTDFDGGTPISAEEYLRRRERLLPCPHGICDEALLDYARQLYGLTFYETASGIAAASETCTVERLPEDLSDEPAAMLKWLDAAEPLKRGYWGFSLA